MTLPSPAAPSDPDLVGDERLLLTEFLDYQRIVLWRKVGELDDDGLRRVMTPSGLTLLGIAEASGVRRALVVPHRVRG